MGALVVGVAAAKALAYALDKPLYGVNHLAGHVAVDLLEHGPLPDALRRAARLRRAHLAAAGRRHRRRRGGRRDRRARRDDRRRGGGGVRQGRPPARPALPRRPGHRPRGDGRPAGDRLPARADSQRDLERHRFDFSFSGLKSAVARWVETRERAGLDVPLADVAASFQEAVCDVLSAKAVDACAATGAQHLLIGGGVAANGRLRACSPSGRRRPGSPSGRRGPGLCTDNGAMIAVLGTEVIRGRRPPVRPRARRGLLRSRSPASWSDPATPGVAPRWPRDRPCTARA